MKMVSQLTRQAMERHRLLSVSTAHPNWQSEERPAQIPIASSPAPSLPPVQTMVSAPSRPPIPELPRVSSIYSQLMTKHDRLNARHLQRT